MMLTTRRRPSMAFLALFVLLCGLPERGIALARIQDVSAARAKQLGITVNPRPREKDVWVQIEFKTAGELEKFAYANLEVMAGEKRLVLAALRPQQLAEDAIRLDFYIDPAALPRSTVTIFAYPAPLSGIGYRLKMKDYPLGPPLR